MTMIIFLKLISPSVRDHRTCQQWITLFKSVSKEKSQNTATNCLLTPVVDFWQIQSRCRYVTLSWLSTTTKDTYAYIHTYTVLLNKDALFPNPCFKADLLLKSAVFELTNHQGQTISKPAQAFAWPPFSRTRQKCQSQIVTFKSKIQHNSCSCRVQMRQQSQRHILKLMVRNKSHGVETQKEKDGHFKHNSDID